MQAASKLILFTLSGILLLSAEVLPPAGNWKLTSEKVLEGDAPAYPIGMVMHWEGTGPSRRGHGDKLLPESVVGHDRMSLQLSNHERTLIEEAQGKDAKTGKPYRYVLTWQRQ